MTALEVIAKEESEHAYRAGEIRIRREAKWAMLRGDSSEAGRLMALAHQVGMEFVRNHIGSHKDRWEQPGTVLR